MKKLMAVIIASVMTLAALPGHVRAEEYLTRHVYDGWNPVYDITKEKYHTYETEHFQIFWGDSGEAGKVTDDFLRNCERVLENCWDKFVVEMGMTPPTTSNLETGNHTTQYKVNVILNETGVEGYGGWAFGGVDREGYPYFMCAPDAMNDWVVPHEMGHVMHFAQGRNAWEGNSYLGPWYEAIGNWFREQYIYDEKCYPEGANYRTDLSALYLRAGSLMAVNGRGYYEAWPLLQYLTDNPDGLPDYGDDFIAKLLNYHPAADDGFYNVLAANTVNSLQDTVGLFASHMATMDFEHKENYNEKIDEMLRNGWLYWQQRYTAAVPYGDEADTYTVPVERTPQSYGYNIIPLEGTGRVGVTLTGRTDLPGAGWRARLAVEGTDGVTRYSALFGSGETAEITVAPKEELYLTVAAAPTLETATKLGLGGWAGFSEGQFPYESKNQYPYSFKLSNAVPVDRTVDAPAALRHPNGGGLVAPTATVDPTAYVGPNAMVLGWAKVSDNAVIDGNAIVAEGANVSGNAYVSGNAVVMGTATVTGNARVLESALVCGSYTVDGNATVKGQAILQGDGKATGQAIAYGDLYEDEGKTIETGAFSGYHCLDPNVNGGYFTQPGEKRYARPCVDKLQARYEFDGNFRDTVAYSDMSGINSPAIEDGTAVFDGSGGYLAVPSSVLSYSGAELRLGIKYGSGTVFDFGGLRLYGDNGRPALTDGKNSVVLDTAFGGEMTDVRLAFLGNTVTLTVNGESGSLSLDKTLRDFAVNGRNYLGKGFSGSVDYLRIFLYDGGELGGGGELPQGVGPVFEAAGTDAYLGSLTADNDSVWCGWQTAGSVSAGTALTVPGTGVKISSPVYGADAFVIEFVPGGDGIYPDHAVIDGEGKYIFAHRYAADAERIYPGRGEQSFCGPNYVTDAAGQKRLSGFAAEAVYMGSALAERGAADYSQGLAVRIIVKNTLWSQELAALYGGAANRCDANLASLKEGDPVYTVDYVLVDGDLPRLVSSSCYKGSAMGFAGIESTGSWADRNVAYGELKIYADSVPRQLAQVEGGVTVTNVDRGRVVFAAYEDGSLTKAETADAAGEGMTRFIPLPQGFPLGSKVMLISDLEELMPLSQAVNVETVLISAVGQNSEAFHKLESKTGKAVYTFEFEDGGSKDSGILLGDSSALNASSGNYFADGSVVILFSEGVLYKRSASDPGKIKIGDYTVGRRISARVEVNIEAGTYDLYLNGELTASDIGFRKSAGKLDTLALVENGGGSAFKVYNFQIA